MRDYPLEQAQPSGFADPGSSSGQSEYNLELPGLDHGESGESGAAWFAASFSSCQSKPASQETELAVKTSHAFFLIPNDGEKLY